MRRPSSHLPDSGQCVVTGDRLKINALQGSTSITLLLGDGGQVSFPNLTSSSAGALTDPLGLDGDDTVASPPTPTDAPSGLVESLNFGQHPPDMSVVVARFQ
jgi:hypothetical protein